MNPLDLERIRSALSWIPSDDRDLWVRMGMAIKSELGDAGFETWDEWSRTSDRYDERGARDSWRSFKPNGGIGAGTLFHEAKARGWRDDGTYQKPTPEAIEARRRIAAERGAKEEAEKARERDQERIAPPAGKFRCFVVDPPWPMQKIEREERPDQGAALDYPTMDVWCTRPLACFHDAIDGYEPCPSVECVVGNVVQRSALDDSIATSTSGSPTSIFQTD